MLIQCMIIFFLQQLKDNYEVCFPLKSVCCRNRYKNPWLTKDLIKLCHKKSQLYKQILKIQLHIERKYIRNVEIL